MAGKIINNQWNIEWYDCYRDDDDDQVRVKMTKKLWSKLLDTAAKELIKADDDVKKMNEDMKNRKELFMTYIGGSPYDSAESWLHIVNAINNGAFDEDEQIDFEGVDFIDQYY